MTAEATYTSLDELHAELERRRQQIAAAERAGDTEAAARITADAGALTAADVDRHLWRGLVARPGVYQRSKDGGRSWRYEGRDRFATVPRLASTYARLAEGRSRFVALIVRNIEPIAYLAAAAIGIGLWALLADLFGSLATWVIVAMLAVSAGGLLAGSAALASIGYREVRRLATLMYVASVAVASWTVWVATEGAFSGERATAVRLALTFGAALIMVTVRYLTRRDRPSYTIAVVVAVPAGLSAGAIFENEVAVFVGALVAVAYVYALAGLTTEGSARLWTYIYASLVTWYTVLVALGLEDGERLLVATAAAAATIVAWGLARDGGRDLRLPVYGNVVVVALLLVSLIPWDELAEFFDAVPLPVLMVVGGSAALIGLALVVRHAVRRVSDDAPPERGPSTLD